MATRRKSTAEQAQDETSFEDALSGLESIVEAMEHEQLPLEDLVAHYEKGTALLDRCEAILKSARERIELITLRNQNEIALESPAEDRQVPRPSSASSDFPDDSDDDDDIRLF